MVVRLKELEHPEAEAARVYLLLIGCAERRETTTYQILHNRLEVAPQSVNARLRLIQTYCDNNGLPSLPTLVVTHTTGEPGTDHPANKEAVLRDRERVYAFDWLDLVAPGPDAFAT